MKRLIDWIADAYHKHGVLAALSIIVVVTGLVLLVAYVTGISVHDIAAWIQYL